MNLLSRGRLRRYRQGILSFVTVLSAGSLGACALMEPVDISEFANEAPEPGSKVVRMANVYESTHPANRCGTATMKRELAKQGIELKVYPGGQLGSEAENVEQVATGALDIGMSTGAFFAAWHPGAEVVDVPFLFEDSRQYDHALRGPTMTKFYDEMKQETGLDVFSSWYYGARQVTANKPVQTPEDFRGMKIRTPDAPLYLQMMRAFGGTATPMALSEVYLGLQQGAIDAQENPIPTINSNKFAEVQSTVSLTGHIIQGVQVVTSERFMDGLEPGEREAIIEAADKARLANLKCVEDEETQILQQWRDKETIEIVEDIDTEAFQDAIREKLLPGQDWADLYTAIQDEIENETPTVVGTDPEDSGEFQSEEGGGNESK